MFSLLPVGDQGLLHFRAPGLSLFLYWATTTEAETAFSQTEEKLWNNLS